MSRSLTAASSHYLYSDAITAQITAYPFTLAIWFRPVGVSGNFCLLSFGDVGGTAQWLRIQQDNTTLSCSVRNPTTVNSTPTVNTCDAGNWHHACGVFRAANDWEIFLNGDTVNSGVNTSSMAMPSNLDRTGIGTLIRSTNTNFFNGLLAYAAIWNVALSDAEVIGLAGGDNPLAVQNANLVGYWPLTSNASPEPDDKNDYDMTVSGATYSSENPSVDAPPSGAETITMDKWMLDTQQPYVPKYEVVSY